MLHIMVVQSPTFNAYEYKVYLALEVQTSNVSMMTENEFTYI